MRKMIKMTKDEWRELERKLFHFFLHSLNLLFRLFFDSIENLTLALAHHSVSAYLRVTSSVCSFMYAPCVHTLCACVRVSVLCFTCN